VTTAVSPGELRHALEVLAASPHAELRLALAQVGERAKDAFVLAAEAVIGERDLGSLQQSMASLGGPVPPELARAAQATENIWRRIENEWGLFSSEDVSMILGSDRPNRTRAAEERKRGRIIGVLRNGAYLHPGFQFDREHGVIRPWVAPLLQLAGQRDRTPEGVALWMVRPTTYLGSERDRPVDHVDDGQLIVRTALNAWGSEW